MSSFLKQFFTWWNGNQLNFRFHLWRHAEKMGEDEFGNVYYQGGTDSEGRPRRYVVYSEISEPSLIPPGWHGWMHHKTDVAPPSASYQAHEWQKPHRPNLTGTVSAYRPKGSLYNAGERPRVTGDYDAWSPGE